MPGKLRPVKNVIKANRQTEGEGFKVARPFPNFGLAELDPFLLLDEMERTNHAPGEAIGTGNHPHKGFETVTYMLEGQFEHTDSLGNSDTIGPGDVQWMTAGAGIIHRERPSKAIIQNGGVTHGFQLWVNLPAKDKLNKPRYQPYGFHQMPTVAGQGWSSKLIAGEMGGQTGPADSFTNILYAHVTVEANTNVSVPVGTLPNMAAYVFKGELGFDESSSSVDSQNLCVFDAGDSIQVATKDQGAEFLLLAGEPIGEPIARNGPFVMNTREELVQAFAQYSRGELGDIAPIT